MTVHVLVKITDSCKIETNVISEEEDNWEGVYRELTSNGWKHSCTRKFEIGGI
ncbi:hypothetical protein NSS71_08280 [Niallia sp. FSL W8-0951]|uniref:hypothetical protein n=1 Tax=unclassified Niallia TaxID=2837522 RepID=UPI0030FA0A3C